MVELVLLVLGLSLIAWVAWRERERIGQWLVPNSEEWKRWQARRKRMMCDRCGEAHTTDALQIYSDGEKACAFCVYATDTWTADGAPTRHDGKQRATREEDRLEAEAESKELIP